MRLATAFNSRIGATAWIFLVLVLGDACRHRPKATANATVRGRIVSANGRALGAATLRVMVPGKITKVVREGVSQRDGAFSIDDIPPGQYLLRADLQGFSQASVPITLTTGETVSTVLRLESMQLLEGVVQDQQGRPLAQAALFAWPLGASQTGVVESSSGADGRFALAGLSPGSWTIMVEAPGFGTLRLERVDVPGRSLVLRLQGEARTLGGMVVGANGAAEVDARVVLGGPALSLPRETRTDGKGLFLFHGLGFGRFVVRGSSANRVSPHQVVVIDEGTGWLPPVRLELGPGATVTGRVTDDHGQPLARAEVELVAAPTDDVSETVRTDQLGRFTAGPAAPGRYQVWARLPGHALANPPDVQLRPDETARIEVKLARAAQITGQVVDDAGKPVVAAVVTAGTVAAGPQDFAVLGGSLPLAAEAAELPAEALNRQSQVRSTATDDQGRFFLPDLPVGRFRLEVTAERLIPVHKNPLDLEAGRTADLGRLVLSTGIAIKGRVLDEQNAPLGAARIEIRPMDGNAAPVFSALSGDDGRFVVYLPKGQWSVLVEAPKRAPEIRDNLDIGRASTPPDMEFRLVRADGIISGLVRDPLGRAAAHARVLAFPLRGGEVGGDGAGVGPAANRGVPLTASSTDRTGRFRLTGVPRGPFIVEVRHPGWPSRSVVATPGEQMTIDLPRPGGIEGEVRDQSTGAFVAAYRLEAQGPDGRAAVDSRTHGAGFELRGLLPGRWRLRVHAEGYAAAEQFVEVPPGGNRNEVSLRNLRIELHRPNGPVTAGEPR